MSECEELVKRLRAKKKAAGFKSGLSEDGGHRVAEMQYVPDPDAQEAATLIATLAAEKKALEAERNEMIANINLKADFIDRTINQLAAMDEHADTLAAEKAALEARVLELEAALRDALDALAPHLPTDAPFRKPYEHPLSAYDRGRAALAREEGKG